MSINIDSKAFETVQDYVIGLYSDHKLEPGDCIYETALAEELGLSRTPVRDALGRLAANGLLRSLMEKEATAFRRWNLGICVTRLKHVNVLKKKSVGLLPKKRRLEI